MKKYTLLFCLCFVCLSNLLAQDEKAFYIYRNDGQFNAFFCYEVDSISYSTLDCDSIEHEEIVVQEVWTQDSIYRIPLSVIDSVSFVKPETKYAKNVIRMDKRYLPYILSTDSMMITFSRDLPEEMRPHKNDVLLYEQFDDMFPEGFVGKVKTINENCVTCDSVAFDDIYEDFVLLGDFFVTEDQNNSKYRLAPNKISEEISNSINTSLNLVFWNHVKIEGNLTLSYRLRVIIRYKKDNPLYLEFQAIDEEKFNLKAGLGEVDIPNLVRTISSKLFGFSLPIPGCPVLKCVFDTFPFAEAKIKGSLTWDLNASSKGKTSLIYKNYEWSCVQTPRENTIENNLNLNVDIYLWFGIKEKVAITPICKFISLGFDFFVGPKISANANWDILKPVYDAIKDSKVSFALRLEADLDFELQFGKKKFEKPSIMKIIPGRDFTIGDFYLFPEFSKPVCIAANKKVDVICDVSRTILFPSFVGFKLLKNDVVIDTYYDKLPYYSNSYSIIPSITVQTSLSNPLKTTFGELKTGKYKICPILKIPLINFEVEASPETSFYYGIDIVTGLAESSYTSAECKAFAKLMDDDGNPIPDMPEEFGFFYNTEGSPTNMNADKVTCQLETNGLFNGNLKSLQDNTTYYYVAYARIGEDYFYGETKTFKTKKFPVKIINFEITNALHEDGGYYFDNNHYDYKFECTTTVQLDDIEGVEDWGYVYKDPNGKDAFISLKGYESPYSDSWHIYYRNKSKSTATLFGYVIFGNDTITDNPKDYELIYGTECCNDDEHPHLVDLGLPSGLRWNCTNLGADVPEGYGSYYAFAELSEKKNYYEVNYQYYYWDSMFDDQYSYYTTIGGGIQNFGTSISAKKGYDVVLEYYDDGRRMPTHEEIQELVDNCKWTWTFRNEIPGYNVEGPNGNSIFLPAAGAKAQGNNYAGEPDRLTYYRSGDWSDRQWSTKGYGWTWGILFKQDSYKVVNSCAKAFGYVIRPVKSGNQE